LPPGASPDACRGGIPVSRAAMSARRKAKIQELKTLPRQRRWDIDSIKFIFEQGKKIS